MGPRALLSCFLLSAVALTPASALEISSGLVKLTLFEGQGRFSLASQAKSSDASFTSLLDAEDPRTSSVSLLVGDKVYRMGEGAAFKETAEKTATGARFTWASSFLVVTETFAFIASKGSVLDDGVRIDLEVRNASEQKLDVGVRYLFDTWLGEASRVHFRTDTLADLSRELTLSKEERPGYWLSPKDDSFGLETMLSGEGITAPDRVVFANWKRLNDAAWAYETSPNRSFSLLPYSVNDSAVCQYYDPKSLGRGEQFTVTLALGRASASGFSLKPAATETAEQFSTSVRETLSAGSGVEDPSLAARTDLATVDMLLAEIDRLLAAKAGATEEQLAVLEQALAALKERSAAAGR